MKKILMIISMIALCFSLTACTFSFELRGPTSNINKQEIIERNEDELEESISGDVESTSFEKELSTPKDNPNSFAEGSRFGTLDNPVPMNETGTIKLYNSVASGYVPVYMRITEKLSSDMAKKLLDDYNESASFMTYEVDESQFDMKAVKFSVDLKDFETPSYGTTYLSPSLTLKSLDDDNRFGDTYIFMNPDLVINVNEDKSTPKYQGDIVDFYFVYAVPKGFTGNHLIRATNDYQDEATRYSYFLIND